jgi:hypothetical protein
MEEELRITRSSEVHTDILTAASYRMVKRAESNGFSPLIAVSEERMPNLASVPSRGEGLITILGKERPTVTVPPTESCALF